MRRTVLIVGAVVDIVAFRLVPLFFARGFGPSEIAKPAQLRTDPMSLASVLDRFRLDCGRYPTTNEGLEALLVAPAALQSRWQGPYANPTNGRILDPWERLFTYVSKRKSHFRLRSLGADGREGGIGEDADASTEE